MDRVTRKKLEEKVAYIARRTGLDFGIDYYNAGMNPQAYKLVTKAGNGYHEMTAHRMIATEFRAYLNGIIDCLDYINGNMEFAKYMNLDDETVGLLKRMSGNEEVR